MKALFEFSEFGVPYADSVKKYFSDSPMEHKKEIVSYMKNCGTEKCVCGIAKDAVDGTKIGTRKIFSDGTYSWTNDLTYYVEKYNLQLGDDFTKHVLKHFRVDRP